MKITWKDFDEASYEIAFYYTDQLVSRKITRLVGLQRGGLPLAVKLSNLMDIPMEVLNYQTRDGETSVEDLHHQLLKLGDLSEILFVDDICDSGKTISIIKLWNPEIKFTTLCSRRSDLIDYSPIMIPESEDGWINFPWEK